VTVGGAESDQGIAALERVPIHVSEEILSDLQRRLANDS